MKYFLLLFIFTYNTTAIAQDLSQGYTPNDLAPHPLQELEQPAYLEAVSDPSFPSTQIRRISDVTGSSRRVPMYSTIQAWNADESMMILYGNGEHFLYDGIDYTEIRALSDIAPDDIETIFWHFNDPNVLFYLEDGTSNFIEYNVSSQEKTIIVNLQEITNCSNTITMGNDVQMMSWDSDVLSFRCGNDSAYYYRISTDTLVQFTIDNLSFIAPMPFPSGNLFYHQGSVYDSNGILVRSFNLNNTGEHSCLGTLSNGDDAYYAIAFEEGPEGDCQGTIVAHNALTGDCFAVVSATDYGYPQSGTHISSLAHKNNEGGWIAASMIGFDRDGQDPLDQELLIAKVDDGTATVYRVAHHRSDEEEYDYFGEPHVTISPSGTRLLFGSDWSGAQDGTSLNAYVAELPAYEENLSTSLVDNTPQITFYPNPASDVIHIAGLTTQDDYEVYDLTGKIMSRGKLNGNQEIGLSQLKEGLYFLSLQSRETATISFIIKR